MIAPIIPIQRGRELKATRLATARGIRIRELAEELLATRGYDGCSDEDARVLTAAYWVQQGWVQQDDARLALEAAGVET